MCIIDFSTSATLSDEFENCIIHLTGLIKTFANNDFNEITIGVIEAYYLDIETALDNDYVIFEIFDAEKDFTSYYHALFDANKMFFKDEITEEFDVNIIFLNLLILEKLEILPDFRGKKIGLAAIYRTIKQFGHACGLVAMIPDPLQFSLYKNADDDDEWFKKMNFSDFSTDKNVALNKLRSYYKKLGFRQLKNSDIFVLNPNIRNPTLEDIGFTVD